MKDSLLLRGIWFIEVRSLESLLQSFISTFNSKSTLSYLLNDQAVSVCFQTEAGNFTMAFFNGKATLITGLVNDKTPSVILAGPIAIIKDLLLGNQKLRHAIARNNLTVRTNFRTTLLLESIFYLTNKGFESELIC